MVTLRHLILCIVTFKVCACLLMRKLHSRMITVIFQICNKAEKSLFTTGTCLISFTVGDIHFSSLREKTLYAQRSKYCSHFI